MCILYQVSQPYLLAVQQSHLLLIELGAFQILQKRYVITDEAAYQAFIVACGRSGSDRQVELVVLFWLLRSDAIFQSTVTLGQYTKAITEEFSMRPGNGENLDENNCARFVGKNRNDIEMRSQRL